MPFTIKGSDAMQLFTFKEKMRKVDSKGGVAIIHPFSKHLGTLIQNDSSISYTHGPDGQKKITYEQFLDEIPALQIREFVPDAKLTQTFKWFSYFKKGFDNAMKDLDSEAAGGWDVVKGKLEEALNSLGENMKKLTSGDAPALARVISGLQYFYQDRGFNVGSDKGLAVLWLPFILYYRLTTTQTNNIYEFPTLMQNNILESDGTYGWGDDNGTDFPLLDMIGSKAKGLVNLVSSGLASTIKVNAMPAFSPTGSAAATSFDIHIDLVNDSEEAAINNFLFCHTLFGNNRWLQYGFVQTGASLYDVKFPGANRYFMCKGRFVCKGKGAFRTPSQKVIDGIVSHKHNTTTADKALNIAEIQEALGAAETREMLQTIANGSSNSETMSLSNRAVGISSTKAMISQVVTNTANTQMAALKTKYPNTLVAISDKSSTMKNSFTTISQEYSKNVATIKENTQRIIQEKDKISTSQKEITEKQSEQITQNATITDLKTKKVQQEKIVEQRKQDAIEFYENNPGVYSSIEECLDSDVGYQNALTESRKIDDSINIETIKLQEIDSSISNLESQINSSRNLIDSYQQRVDDAKQANIDLESRPEFKEVSKSIGEDSVKHLVVDVKSETWRDLIKIPDVYSLTLTFSSLIPDNFNNYLYGWRAGNLDPIDNYFRGTVEEKGVMEKLVDNLIVAVGGK